MQKNRETTIVNTDENEAWSEAPLVLTYDTVSPLVHVFSRLLGICMVGITLYFISQIILRNEIGKYSDFYSLSVLAIPLVVGMAPFAINKFLPKARLTLSAKSLKFSQIWWGPLLSRLERSWDDVHSISLVYEQGSTGNALPSFKDNKISVLMPIVSLASLCFDFKSGGNAQIRLALLTRKEAEELFKAIEKYGDPSKFSTDFVKLERAILLEQLDSPSFTQLWAEDLNTSYVATNYLPLRSNHKLQDGRYTVLMEMAAGGMSAVYLALDENKNKVVIKEAVVPANISSQQRQKSRELFEREANLLLHLKHPQIARVLDRFIEQNRDYIVLQFVPGLSLRQLVKARGKQSERTVLNWARQICEILVYLHSQNPPIVHRDLSPDNLMLADNGDIVLVDFGAANELVTEATGTMIGKQCYMAPEQLRGKANCQSDLYSLGATLHYLLTGEEPTPLSQSKPSQLVAKLSPGLDALVSSLTDYESENRPDSARAVLSLVDQLETTQGHKRKAITGTDASRGK